MYISQNNNYKPVWLSISILRSKSHCSYVSYKRKYFWISVWHDLQNWWKVNSISFSLQADTWFFFASCTAHIWLKFFHETNKHSLWTVKYRGVFKKDSNTVQLSQYRHQRTCHSVHIVGVFVTSGLSDKTSWTHVLMIETPKQTVLQGNVKL